MKKKILTAIAFTGLGLSLVACSGNNGYTYNNRPATPAQEQYNDGYDTDTHYEFVRGLGFENVTNPNGYGYHQRYRLDKTTALDNDVFHGWRHAWAEPGEYMDKDIDVYRYTANYNGEPRIVHIKSHNGRVLGGYHFRDGETVEHASIINHNGYLSRLGNDFRTTWDDLFGIRG